MDMDIDATALSPELTRALDDAIGRRFEAVKAAYLESLAIPSIKAAPAEGAPYGPEVARVLDHAMDVANRLGLSARMVDGRAMIAEAGEGAEYVAGIGHMDVVPPGAGWTREPFGPVVEGDRVYARGACDDKCGSFALLLAVAAVNDLLSEGVLELPRAVRAILGGDEESGMTCVRHVMSVEGAPAWSVAPDGDWPVVFAEKGQALVELAGACPAGEGLYVKVIEAGTRANVVPDLAEAVLAGDPAMLVAAAGVLEGYWDRNVSWRREGDGISIRAIGLAGHGSRPHLGDNAAVRLLRLLRELPLSDRPFWDGLFRLCDASGCGLAVADCDDVTGATTCNLGVLRVAEGRVVTVFDIRHPARRDQQWVLAQLAGPISKAGLAVVEVEGVPPVHQPIDGPLVRTIMAVYNAHSDDGKGPYSRGAKTYASYVPRCVCVGRTLPGETDGGVHGPDENYTFTGLRGAGRMLAELLIRLARTPTP